MKINRFKFNNMINGFIFLFPFFTVYLLLFWTSNETAFDRDIYINGIMANPFSGREEPGLHFVSYLLGFIVENPKIKLFIVQFFFVTLLILTLSSSFKGARLSGLAKSLLVFVIIVAVFSNQLGVQLRVGYGSILFCFMYFFLKLKPNLKNITLYILPCLMHMGLIPAVMMLYFFYFFKINTFVRFLPLLFLALGFSVFFITYMETIFQTIGVPAYYFQYLLGGDLGEGRKVPFSVLFYLFLLLFIFLRKNEYKHEVSFWYCFSGLFLVVVGAYGIYVFFKMLVPITLFLIIHCFERINFEQSTSFFLIVLFTIVFPISSYYYSLQVGL